MKALVFTVFLTFSFCAKGQLNPNFIKHLSTNSLQKEHYTYLNNAPIVNSNDSIKYYKAKYFLQYFNSDSLIYYFTISRELFLRDTCAVFTANLNFLKENNKIRTHWFDLLLKEDLSGSSQRIINIYVAGKNPDSYPVDSIPIDLQQDYIKLKKIENKYPLVAAGLSFLIPGFGKLYAGRTRSFVVTFFTHVFFALQSYELAIKIGLSHPFSLLSLAYFGGFYFANIYGSFNEVTEAVLQLKNQFYINVSEYYTVHPSCSLY